MRNGIKAQPHTDRIILTFLRAANDYERKAEASTSIEVRSSYLAAREEQIKLVRSRMAAYGIKDVSENVLERLLRSAG